MASTISAGTTAGTAIAIAGDTTGNLAFQTNGTTTAVTINTSQNVGIGTTAPPSLLSIGTLGVTTSPSINFGGSTTATQTIEFGRGTSGAQQFDGYIQYTQSNNALAFGTNGATERMRIDSSGNVIVNDTAILANSAGKLQVACSAPSGGNQYGVLVGGNSTQYSVWGMRFLNTYTPAIVGNIIIGSSTTQYQTSSDYRLKEDIAPMTGALDKVALLKPVTYKWKTDGKDGQGFIAHELAEVCPDAVSGEKDAMETYTDEDGNEQTRINPQGIDTSFLVATLTAAIQELNAKVDAQAAEIAALKGAQ